MKAGILCNSSMALPALQFFMQAGLAIEVAMPDVDNDDTPELKHFFASVGRHFTTLAKKDFAISLKRWIERHKPDVVFVITFPWKIPAHILTMPPLGFFNFHYALLPQYRGASPIFWQLRNGEAFGGLTIHKMDEGWDTGPIAQLHKVVIAPGETFGMHQKKVAWQTLPGVQEFVQKLVLLGKSMPLTPQNHSEAKYYPRPSANDITINWQTMTAVQIQNLVRACNPWNKGAYTFFNQNVFKIVQVDVKEQESVNNQKLIPGTVINCSEKKTIDIITVDNSVAVLEVIHTEAGFYTADFLLQIGVKTGMVLTNTI